MKPILGEYYLTQGYGLTSYARSPAGKAAYANFPGGIHPGLDFGTHGINLPILATCDGEVVTAGKAGGWGNLVEVKGLDGWRRMYAHLSVLFVHVGQPVNVGEQMGRVGTTGTSTGIHLHYGHRKSRLNGLAGWDYRDPSFEVQEAREVAPAPVFAEGSLLKVAGGVDIFFWTGTHIHRVPNMLTLKVYFGNKKFQEVGADVLSKLPTGAPIPSV